MATHPKQHSTSFHSRLTRPLQCAGRGNTGILIAIAPVGKCRGGVGYQTTSKQSPTQKSIIINIMKHFLDIMAKLKGRTAGEHSIWLPSANHMQDSQTNPHSNVPSLQAKGKHCISDQDNETVAHDSTNRQLCGQPKAATKPAGRLHIRGQYAPSVGANQSAL